MAEEDVNENLEVALEKEVSSLDKRASTISNESLLETIKANLCTCAECNTKFIKRKKILICPICHSKEVS